MTWNSQKNDSWNTNGKKNWYGTRQKYITRIAELQNDKRNNWNKATGKQQSYLD